MYTMIFYFHSFITYMAWGFMLSPKNTNKQTMIQFAFCFKFSYISSHFLTIQHTLIFVTDALLVKPIREC